MAKGGRMCRFGWQKGSLIEGVLDERGSGPKEIVGAVSATPGASSIGHAALSRKSIRGTSAQLDGSHASATMDCGSMRPSAETFSRQSSRRGSSNCFGVPTEPPGGTRKATSGVETWNLPTTTVAACDDSQGQWQTARLGHPVHSRQDCSGGRAYGS